MDLRTTFNTDEYNYDQARPGYPDALFTDLFTYSGAGKNTKVLEIGIGTGQATEPFLKAGCDVTAVELGDKLAEYSAKKFAAYGNLRIIVSDFLEADLPDHGYDLIYCATAFHWIPKEEGYRKIHSLLRPGGSIALFWNHPFASLPSDESNVASMAVYRKHRPDDKVRMPWDETKCREREAELREYGFYNITSRLYHRTRTLSTDAYLRLINTYSDHLALPQEKRTAFEEDMRQAIDAAGGVMRIYDTIDLYLARSQEKER